MQNGDEPTEPNEKTRGSESAQRAPGRILRLLPGSGIQFYEFSLPAERLALTYGRFVEDHSGHGPVLVPLSAEPDYEGVEWHPATQRALKPEETLWINGFAAVERFLGCWLPLPYLRVLGRRDGHVRLDAGPSNWARLFLDRPPVDLRQGGLLKGVIAFDTRIADLSRMDQEDYAAPNADDVLHEAEFRLANQPDALADLLADPWHAAWLSGIEASSQGLGKTMPGRLAGGPSDSGRLGGPGAFLLAHTARYLTLLNLLERAVAPPAVRLIRRDETLEAGTGGLADLVIDFGDDATTAALLDRNASREPEPLAGARLLPIRDLSRPIECHVGPFPTHVEFQRPEFGPAAVTRLSSRADAFQWPSLVRIGQEARRLSLRSSAVVGVTGLGGLRSALGETEPRLQTWRFARDDEAAIEPGAMVAGELMRHLGEDGTVLAGGVEGGLPALRPRFSASALLAQAVAELVLHAVAAAGADGHGARLGRVVVTAPADAGADERALLAERVRSGIALVWTAFGWHAAGSRHTPAMPNVATGLDASLGAHLVHLNEEIEGRCGGDVRELFGGRESGSARGHGQPRLTLASLDLAAGASALTVVAYELGRDGDVATDLVLADRSGISGRGLSSEVIRAVIVPGITGWLEQLGHARAAQAVAGASEGSMAASGNDPHLAIKLRSKVLEPAASGLLEMARAHSAGSLVRGLRSVTLGELVTVGGGTAEAAARLLERLAAPGAIDVQRVAELPISYAPRVLQRLAGEHYAPLLARVGELARELAADAILLTGPFARLAEARGLLIRDLAMAPHRIIDMTVRTATIARPLTGTGGADAAARLLPLAGVALAGMGTAGALGIGTLRSSHDSRGAGALPGVHPWREQRSLPGDRRVRGADIGRPAASDVEAEQRATGVA